MTKLERQYEKLLETYHFERAISTEQLTRVLREALQRFTEAHARPAIYCYGAHTKMMMADFMFELKSVHYIIDNYCSTQPEGGFEVIPERELSENGIDGVIVSSYKFKEPIKASLRAHHPEVDVLDIYDVLAQHDLPLLGEYYRYGHPYHHYRRIHELREALDASESADTWRALVQEYLTIQDFRLAWQAAGRLVEVSSAEHDQAMADDTRALMEAEQEAIRKLSSDHVVMICMDGMRRADVSAEKMPQLDAVLRRKSRRFTDAYAYSTSTYESLLPVYSQNSDQRTQYFLQNSVAADACPFIQEAIREQRPIHFYTDMADYVAGDAITYAQSFETATQKIWSFVNDASEETRGLYYLHILYESHYTFSNPYTRGKFLSEGTAMLFDYLEKLGGKLRTDYVQQHDDTLRYLDDTMAPFFDALPCRAVLFADHGNLVLPPGTELSNVDRNELTCHEDWIRIPFAVFSPEVGAGEDPRIFSLMNMNDVLLALLKKTAYAAPATAYVKIGRSELYNPDFRFLYQSMGEAHRLLAFEGFVFASGEKLVVYADGAVELYDRGNDRPMADATRAKALLMRVKAEITVCPLEQISVA